MNGDDKGDAVVAALGDGAFRSPSAYENAARRNIKLVGPKSRSMATSGSAAPGDEAGSTLGDEALPDPFSMRSPLMPHQRAALDWMLGMEAPLSSLRAKRDPRTRPGIGAVVPVVPRGGLLADDMGLGKTVECIALMCAATPTPPRSAPRTGRPACGPNLVVAPAQLLCQWRDEMMRHAGVAPCQVLIYAGALRRAALARFLMGGPCGCPTAAHAPFAVVASYECVQREHASAAAPKPRNSPLFIRPCAQRPEARAPACGRSVPGRVPSDGCIHLCTGDMAGDPTDDMAKVHGGSSSDGRPILEKKGPRRKACAPELVLHRVRWHRIMLDEAHRIRSRQSPTSQAVRALASLRRWCVTGTPLNNTMRDIAALAEFIGTPPYCRRAWWRKQGRSGDNNLPPAGLPDADDPPARERGGPSAAVDAWRTAFMLRRTKSAALLHNLPAKTVEVVSVPLPAVERAVYDALTRAARDDYARLRDPFMTGREREHAIGAALAWVTRLRRACVHPMLALGRQWSAGLVAGRMHPPGAADAVRARASPARCAHCGLTGHANRDSRLPAAPDAGRPPTEAVVAAADNAGRHGARLVPLDCRHFVCVPCAGRRGGRGPCGVCAACSLWWGGTGAGPGPVASARVQAVVDVCCQHFARDPDAKAVVFSQWAAVLDVLECAFAGVGLGTARYDGDDTDGERRAATLARFGTRATAADAPVPADGPRVLLCSLACASVGLNLTRANLALLVDPSYNPCTEDQAMDRVYRFGQERDVRVVRFMAPLTAEADVDRARQAKAHLARLFVEAAFTRLCSRAPFVYVDDDRDGNDAREAGNRNPPCTRREKRTHPPMAEAKTSSADPDVTGSLLSVGISSASADGSPPAKRRKLGPAQADANRCDVAPPPPGDEATCTLAERVRDAAAADEFFGFVCPFGAAAACDKGRPSLSPKGRKRKRTEGESPQPSRLSPAGQGQKKKDDGK